ncbi:MAG TPA: hypothetical protein VJL89_09775 [Thermodesulfovibrionia bacterium]|nr:hypothetical protein [Thermodesulfovibrionia bacterium]
MIRGRVSLLIIFAVLYGIIMLKTGNAGSNLVRSTDGLIVEDKISGLTWFANLEYFDNLSYDAQKEAIAKLPGGKWRMATLQDIRSLAKHSENEIGEAFKPVKVSFLGSKKLAVYNGRVDCKEIDEGSHMMAYMSHDVDRKQTCAPFKYEGLSITDGKLSGVSAWVVCDQPDVKMAQEELSLKK